MIQTIEICLKQVLALVVQIKSQEKMLKIKFSIISFLMLSMKKELNMEL